MSTLQAELNRLYLCGASSREAPTAGERGLMAADGAARALVLELARPADWTGISAVWQGVQTDLKLPAPAIAVSGVDGYQLWFSLTQSVPIAQAQAFLESLRAQYLGTAESGRVAVLPSADSAAQGGVRLARMVPEQQPETGFWSAFVAPDLAAIFSDEPWLDAPPTPDGQAAVLSRLECIKPAAFEEVLAQIGRATKAAISSVALPTDRQGNTPTMPGVRVLASAGSVQDPKDFLLGVMNNQSIELPLRIEAAKALLPYFERRSGG